MKISVAIPAHNEERYIARCLDSLAHQDCALEIIVCLNVCADKTEEIVREYARSSPWPIQVVYEERKGVGWARQTASLAASGEIIASADADAIYPRDWAARIVRAFSEDPQLVVLYGPVRLQGFGTFWKFFHPVLNDTITHVGRLVGWHNVIGSNFAMRREAFLAVGGFNTSLKALEDHEIVRRLRRLGRVRYDAHLVAYASARRYNRLGVWKTISFYVRNAVRALVFKRETEDLEDLTAQPPPTGSSGRSSKGGS
jgi:glycosyltransferase involved in cell wall biosynthesis